MGRGLPGPPAADGPVPRPRHPHQPGVPQPAHRRPRPRHPGLPARGPAHRRPDPAAPGNRKLEAVDTLFRGVFGPGYRAALDHGLPGAFEQAVADADAFFTQEMPALQQWPFTEDDARRIPQPALAVLGQPAPRSSRNGRSCCCVGCPTPSHSTCPASPISCTRRTPPPSPTDWPASSPVNRFPSHSDWPAESARTICYVPRGLPRAGTRDQDRSSPLCGCCQVNVRVSLKSASTVRVWLPWRRAVSWCPGPGAAARRAGVRGVSRPRWSQSRPGCPPGPLAPAALRPRASARRRAKMASLIRRLRDRSASLCVLPSASFFS